MVLILLISTTMPNDGKQKKEGRKKDKIKPSEEDHDAEEVDLADIMAELKTQRRDIISRLESIDSRLDDVIAENAVMKEDISQVNEALDKQDQRLGAAEQRISDLEDKLQTSNRELHRAQKLIETLEAKTDDLENRGRRKNLVLLGLPEKTEGGNIFDFIQRKLPEWLNIQNRQTLEFERIHRVGQLLPPPKPGKPKNPPRPIMIRFLRFRDCDKFLQAAKKKTTAITEDESELTFRQDLSAEVRRKRREYSEVIVHLRQKDMFRGFKYPHRLRAFHDGKIKLFDSPPEVKSFIDELNMQLADTELGSDD